MTNKELLKLVGRRIAVIRKDRNINQTDLETRSGKPISTISNIECGVVDPKLTTLFALSKALEVPLPEIIDLDQSAIIARENERLFIETTRILRRLSLKNLTVAKSLIETLYRTTQPQ